MSRPRRFGHRSSQPLIGLAVAVLLAGGILPRLSAADPIDTPPTLPVSTGEALPESLRKPVPASVEELRLIQDRVRSLIDELRAVTVGVRRGVAQGTGVIVSKDGYVLTAAHVSGPPGRRVTLIRNDGSILDAVSLGREERLDAGLVKITSPGTWPVAEIADLDHLRQGDWVVGTGHPGGFEGDRLPVIRLGRVIAKMKWIIHTDVTLVGGDSGGPLFDLDGRVVGIHSRIGPGAELNFHVPVSAYIDNWHWLIRSEERPVNAREGGPLLGIDGEDVDDGCEVTRVSAGSPAERAGIEEGDVIARLDDRFILGLDDLVASVNHYDAGDTITVAFYRDGERRTVRLTLAVRPPRGD